MPNYKALGNYFDEFSCVVFPIFNGPNAVATLAFWASFSKVRIPRFATSFHVTAVLRAVSFSSIHIGKICVSFPGVTKHFVLFFKNLLIYHPQYS